MSLVFSYIWISMEQIYAMELQFSLIINRLRNTPLAPEVIDRAMAVADGVFRAGNDCAVDIFCSGACGIVK